jgi:uncharacterized protein YbbC (DUF1343 family)
MLKGVYLLVIELQDVGTRIYTFIYTMANWHVGAQARRAGIVCAGLIQLAGGGRGADARPRVRIVRRPISDSDAARHDHRELARLFNDHFGIGADLEVVGMEGWRRHLYHEDTGLPWVLPSPNIPTNETAVVYPGAVLFEGTNVSEGRGTTRPFELVGAPWVMAERFADGMNRLDLAGVRFRPALFEPTFHKHAKTGCGGCQIHVLDRASFRPVETAAALLTAFRAADPGQFAWRPPPYEYEHEKLPIDILAGSSALREQIDTGTPVREIARSWEPAVAAFGRVRKKFLAY